MGCVPSGKASKTAAINEPSFTENSATKPRGRSFDEEPEPSRHERMVRILAMQSIRVPHLRIEKNELYRARLLHRVCAA